MKTSGGFAALVAALVLLCAVVAWEWYSHVGGTNAAPQPVQQIAGSPAPADASPAEAAPTRSPSPAPAATAAATATPAPVVYLPQASPTPQTTVAPAPAGTAAPTATPYAVEPGAIHEEPMVAATLGPHVVAVKPIREPPDAPPRILSMSMSTPVAHGGDVVSGYVLTTSNVASVEARIAGYSSSMRKVGVGKFVLTYRVPHLPFFLHRTYNIEVIARNTRGDAVRSSLPITIR